MEAAVRFDSQRARARACFGLSNTAKIDVMGPALAQDGLLLRIPIIGAGNKGAWQRLQTAFTMCRAASDLEKI